MTINMQSNSLNNTSGKKGKLQNYIVEGNYSVLLAVNIFSCLCNYGYR